MEIYFSIISSPFLLYNVDLAWKSVVHKFVDLPVVEDLSQKCQK